MRSLTWTIGVVLGFALALPTLAQTDGISYQAVIIDNNAQEIPGVDVSGNYLSQGEVSLRFTIFDSEGAYEYQEEQDTITDKFGMISLIIGQGETTVFSQGEFNEISWDGTPKQLLVELSYAGGEFQTLSEQELLFVPYAYHRNITATGTLDVDGETTLNSGLSVMNQSLTYLSGDLQVDGSANIDTDLSVQGNSTMEGDLNVNGTTNINGPFNVNDGSPSYMSGDLTVDGTSNFNGDANFNGATSFNSITVENESFLNGDVFIDGYTNVNNGMQVNGNSIFMDHVTANSSLTVAGQFTTLAESNMQGRVTIDADVNGADTSPGSYPLCVKGSNQGIHVEVDGSANNSSNYITFEDNNGIHGAIEAQSYTDLTNSFEYDWEFALYVIDIAFMTAEGIACSAQLDFGEAGIIATNLIAYGIHYQNREDYVVANYGIYFKSGGADYAEYLEKQDHSEIFRLGDIVGVHGGKISHDTEGADHIMVISTDPIVLGNMPEDGQKENFEKVAFLGQVPVRVVGKVSEGDYILPSGNNDGMGFARSPEDMSTEDYMNILGVSWQSASSDVMSVVNVAVGLNHNDVAAKIQKQEERMNELEKELEMLKAMVLGEESQGSASALRQTSSLRVNSANARRDSNLVGGNKNERALFSAGSDEFDAWLDENIYIFEFYMDQLKAEYERRGIDYQRHPEIALWVDSPRDALKQMHQGEFMPSLWDRFLEKYPDLGM